MKTIAVYGSSRITPHDEEYMTAQEVGRLLGQAGYAVMTGGYAGAMEAVSRGAAEAGGHVIGVTTTAITALRPEGANPWVHEVIHYDRFSERVGHLVRHAQGYVAMQGGVGTLHEVVSAWELMRIGEIPRAPIICYGVFWQEILHPVMTTRYIHPEYQELIHFAHSPAEVVVLLRQFITE